jgi:uncharacterized membrane protein (DUF2068 family)
MSGRYPHAAGDAGTTEQGLRIIAMVEATKGGLVLAAGLGGLSLVHRDVQHLVEAVVEHFHLNPASHYPRIFIEAAAHITDARLWFLASGALIYALMRFIEAYGLWRYRRWAVWVSLMTGGLYVPVELYELMQGVTWAKVVVLSGNAAMVGYLSYTRWPARRQQRQGRP